MTEVKQATLRAHEANDALEQMPSYHETLLDTQTAWSSNLHASQRAIRTGELEDTPTTAEDTARRNAHTLQSIPTLDLTRLTELSTLRNLGDLIIATGVDRSHPGLKRGKMNDPIAGLPLQDGTKAQLDPELLDEFAQSHFDVDESFVSKTVLTLPSSVRNEMRISQNRDTQEWDVVSDRKRAKYQQSAYEVAIALSVLQRADPAAHDSLLQSSQLLKRLSNDTIKPYLTGLTQSFRERFVREQLDVAWAWRNMLEPGKKHEKPILTEPTQYFVNQMGLGMIEYLLPTGRDVLTYLRSYGDQMQEAPFRRVEIQKEHLNDYLLGVPLQDGEVLLGSPEVFVFLGREHHELWRFSRELSWLIPDKRYHQPNRKVHASWNTLDVATHNRDILNVFGLCYMLSKMPENDFQNLLQASPAGNPYQFPLTPIKRVKSSFS